MRMIPFMVAAIMLILIAISTNGCSSIPLQSASKEESAKSFRAPSGKGLIYVYPAGFMASTGSELLLDGRYAGTLWDKGFYMFVVDPGSHTVTHKGTGTTNLPIEVEGGKIYFVKSGFRHNYTDN